MSVASLTCGGQEWLCCASPNGRNDKRAPAVLAHLFEPTQCPQKNILGWLAGAKRVHSKKARRVALDWRLGCSDRRARRARPRLLCCQLTYTQPVVGKRNDCRRESNAAREVARDERRRNGWIVML